MSRIAGISLYVTIWIWNIPYGLKCLNTSSPPPNRVLGNSEHFRIKSPVGKESLGSGAWGLSPAPHPDFYLPPFPPRGEESRALSCHHGAACCHAFLSGMGRVTPNWKPEKALPPLSIFCQVLGYSSENPNLLYIQSVLLLKKENTLITESKD